MKNNIKQGRHAELVSASSPHVVLEDKLQAWKISNQAHNDNTNFTSGLHPTYTLQMFAVPHTRSH